MSQSHTGSLVDWSNSQIAANECPEAIEFGHGHGLSKIKSFSMSKDSANCKISWEYAWPKYSNILITIRVIG